MDQDISRRGENTYDLPPDIPPIPASDPPDPTVRAVADTSARRHDAETDKPVRANGAATNGNGSKPKEPVSLFWQQPIAADEEVNWFVPPLPRREEQNDQVVGLLNELNTMMPHMPMRSWLARWNYFTR
jgi:hypothetical protein